MRISENKKRIVEIRKKFQNNSRALSQPSLRFKSHSRCNFPLNATIRFSMLFSKFPRGLSESIDRKHDLHRWSPAELTFQIRNYLQFNAEESTVGPREKHTRRGNVCPTLKSYGNVGGSNVLRAAWSSPGYVLTDVCTNDGNKRKLACLFFWRIDARLDIDVWISIANYTHTRNISILHQSLPPSVH